MEPGGLMPQNARAKLNSSGDTESLLHRSQWEN